MRQGIAISPPTPANQHAYSLILSEHIMILAFAHSIVSVGLPTVMHRLILASRIVLLLILVELHIQMIVSAHLIMNAVQFLVIQVHVHHYVVHHRYQVFIKIHANALRILSVPPDSAHQIFVSLHALTPKQ